MMKTRLLAYILTLLALAGAGAPLHAQTFTQVQWGINRGVVPATVCVLGAGGTCLGDIGTLNISTGLFIPHLSLPHVANNTALAANPHAATPVVRDGFATAGDGGQATYTYSGSACSAADGGAQVAATGGGCWLAELSAVGATNIKLWGAPTNGVNDDTPAADLGFAYLNSKGGGKLYLPFGKVVFNGLTMPYNGLALECPWTDSTQILPGSSSGNTIIMGSGTDVGAATVFDLEVNNCTFVPKTGNVQTGGSYVIVNNANTTRLTNTRHFGGYKPVSITNNSVINYVTQAQFTGTASDNGVDITIAGGGDQFLSNINAVGASGGTQPSACINIQESGGVWLTNIDCISQGDGLLINPTGGKQVLWTFGSNIAFDTGLNGLNVNPTAGGIVKGLSIYGLWTSSNTNWGATFTGSGGGSSTDQVELVGHRSYNNGRDGAVIAFGGNFTINGGSYCGNSATTPGVDSGINIGVGMNRVSVLNARIGSCVGYGATQARGIILQPSAATNNILIIGNDLTGNVAPVFNGVTTPGGVVTFANNIGYPDSATTTINGVVCVINSSCTVTPGGAAGGDLSGTYPNPTVAKINGVSVPAGPYAVGDILYASTTTALSRLADVATGQVLHSGGVTTAPAYSAVSLIADVSGILSGANGGTGVANTGKTLTLGASLATTGAGAPTLAFPASPFTYTYPGASQTLASLAGTEVFTNKDLTSGTNTFPTLNQNTTGSAAKWTTARNLAGNSVDGSANVAYANKFIVQGTTDAGLSAAQFLGALGTGLLKNTTTTGVLSIATAGTDYLTSVGLSFTGGLISVGSSPLTANGTIALTVAGTSGGIPYFSSTSGWASSALLVANAIVVGGGAGVAPATTTTGTGVLTALGVNVGSAGAFVTFNGAGGTPSSLTLTNATALPAASVSSGALANGMTATTQAVSDNSTKIATTAYVDRSAPQGAWTAYTPTVSGATGLSSATGAWIQNGKTITVRIDILWGTASGLGASLNVSLPATGKAGNEGVGCGRESAVGGTFFCGTLNGAATTAVFNTATNGNPIVTNGEYTHTFIYEAL